MLLNKVFQTFRHHSVKNTSGKIAGRIRRTSIRNKVKGIEVLQMRECKYTRKTQQ
jgi:hypothetical protein